MSPEQIEVQRLHAKARDRLAARFALAGHALTVSNHDGRELLTVSRWGQSRTFSHLGDAEAFLTQVQTSSKGARHV